MKEELMRKIIATIPATEVIKRRTEGLASFLGDLELDLTGEDQSFYRELRIYFSNSAREIGNAIDLIKYMELKKF